MNYVDSQAFKVRFGQAEHDARLALRARFGSFDDLQDILVKPNPKPSTKEADKGEDIYIRNDQPPTDAPMQWSGGAGEVREDSLVWTITNGAWPTYCAVSSAVWILLYVDLMRERLANGDTDGALGLAYVVGEHHLSLRMSKIIGGGWTRMGQTKRKRTEEIREAMNARMQKNGNNRSEAARYAFNELGLGHSVGSNRELLRPKRQR